MPTALPWPMAFSLIASIIAIITPLVLFSNRMGRLEERVNQLEKQADHAIMRPEFDAVITRIEVLAGEVRMLHTVILDLVKASASNH